MTQKMRNHSTAELLHKNLQEGEEYQKDTRYGIRCGAHELQETASA